MSTQAWKRMLAVCLTSLIFFPSVNNHAAAQVNILPPGYKIASLSTDWINGSGQPQQCAVLAARDYPGRPWQIMSSSEEMRWGNETFHIDAQYRYHCTLLVKVEQ
jgi:hypothetical protein